MSYHSDSFRQSHILGALPSESRERLLPHLESVDLSRGKLLYEIDDSIGHVYFPFDAMISLVTQMADGKIVEVGLVGRDGMTGITGLMGNANSYERAIVQIPGGGCEPGSRWLKTSLIKAALFSRFCFVTRIV